MDEARQTELKQRELKYNSNHQIFNRDSTGREIVQMQNKFQTEWHCDKM